jgi:hypothetical protein
LVMLTCELYGCAVRTGGPNDRSIRTREPLRSRY